MKKKNEVGDYFQLFLYNFRAQIGKDVRIGEEGVRMVLSIQLGK